jgi:hypothetical protein
VRDIFPRVNWKGALFVDILRSLNTIVANFVFIEVAS